MAVKDTLTRFKEKEREKRKDLILDAAEKVFSTRPYDKVSMREIADEAGIATSSIYTYFPNQENLFLETTLREIHVLIKAMTRISNENIGDREKIGKIIDSFLDYIARNESYFRMMTLFMTQGNLTDESRERLFTVMRRVFDILDGIFVRLSYPGNVRTLSHFFFATLNGILVTYRKLPGRGEKEVIAYMKELGCVLKELIAAAGAGKTGVRP